LAGEKNKKGGIEKAPKKRNNDPGHREALGGDLLSVKAQVRPNKCPEGRNTLDSRTIFAL